MRRPIVIISRFREHYQSNLHIHRHPKTQSISTIISELEELTISIVELHFMVPVNPVLVGGSGHRGASM